MHHSEQARQTLMSSSGNYYAACMLVMIHGAIASITLECIVSALSGSW